MKPWFYIIPSGCISITNSLALHNFFIRMITTIIGSKDLFDSMGFFLFTCFPDSYVISWGYARMMILMTLLFIHVF